jgi:hypothetical protein
VEESEIKADHNKQAALKSLSYCFWARSRNHVFCWWWNFDCGRLKLSEEWNQLT